jgi:uncharacterized protein (DUF736 family)
MANYEQRDNSGVLFANNKKTSDKHPDYRGDSMINGKMVEVAAWIKTSSSGNIFYSLSFKDKQEYRPSQREPGSDDDAP